MLKDIFRIIAVLCRNKICHKDVINILISRIELTHFPQSNDENNQNYQRLNHVKEIHETRKML